MAVSVPTVFWSALAGFGAVRALYQPYKAILREGTIVRCAGGPTCETSMQVDSVSGVGPVYSVVRGTVLKASPREIQIAARRDRAIVTYRGDLQLTGKTRVGAQVGTGQAIAHSSSVLFSVERIQRSDTGALSLVPLEPAAWLAARGLRASGKKSGGSPLWCSQGRKLAVPRQVGGCGMRLPDPAAFALLPVSVNMQ